MANTFLEAQGKALGKSKVEKRQAADRAQLPAQGQREADRRCTCRPTWSSRPGSTPSGATPVVGRRDPRRRDGARHRPGDGRGVPQGARRGAHDVLERPDGRVREAAVRRRHRRGRARARRQQARAHRGRRRRLGGGDRAGRARRQGHARVDRRRRLARVRAGPRPARHRCARRRPLDGNTAIVGVMLRCAGPASGSRSSTRRVGCSPSSTPTVAGRGFALAASARSTSRSPTASRCWSRRSVAGDLPPPPGGPPRWVVGDGANAARVAGAAAQAGAAGVLLTPVSRRGARRDRRTPSRRPPSSTSRARAA